MATVKLLLSGLVLLALTACAGTYRSYVDTLNLVFTATPDAELSLAEVQQSKYDLLYVTHGERPQAVMVLMYLEAGQHKWISADNAMLVMEQGRIVRTLGFAHDLLYLTNTISDPLSHKANIKPNSSWLRLADWKHGEYGYALKSRFEVMPAQELIVFQQKIDTIMIIEYVQYEDNANYLRFDGGWKNYFWFDSRTGTLLKSEQKLAPFWQPITMTYASRIARLLKSADMESVGDTL